MTLEGHQTREITSTRQRGSVHTTYVIDLEIAASNSVGDVKSVKKHRIIVQTES